jgi:hypothetical protein
MYTDVASLNMLASATKGLQTLQDLAKDFGVIAKNYHGMGMGVNMGHPGGGRNRHMMENLMMNQQMDF